MVRSLTYIILCFILFAPAVSADASEMRESIAAVVNDEPITMREVEERLALVLASSQLPDDKEIRQRLKPQILDQLVEEQIKLQEAQRQEIEVPENAIKAGIESVAQSNNLSYEEFISLLKRQDVEIRTLRRQVRAQIAWSQVIGKVIRPRLRITDQDVEAELNRLKENIGKTEFLLAEIFLPINQSNAPEEVEKFANNLVRQMVERKAPFQRVAQQFSQSAAAARGGDIGWIQEGQLPEPLDNALQNMDKGNLSPPIKTLSGYHILLLRDKREITEETLPSAEEMNQRLGLERLERQQRRLLIDLRSSAFIDVRV